MREGQRFFQQKDVTADTTTAASRAHAHDTWCPRCTSGERALCAAAGCQAPQDNEP